MKSSLISTATCWKLEAWPEQDRAAWRQHIEPDDPFGDEPGHYGADLQPDTLAKIVKGYGRWLSFLDSRGWLDTVSTPFERVTVPRLRAYARTLIRSGNQPRTVVGRFAELTMAMKIMAPGHDVSWISKPDGVTIYSLLRKRQKAVRVPPTPELYKWGLEMMKNADIASATTEGMLAYRDGLMVTIFAARARRLRSMVAVCVGEELLRKGGRFRIELKPSQVKTKPPDGFWLPDDLASYIDVYLKTVRPALAGRHNHTDLFIGQSGHPLTRKGMAGRINVLSQRKFGHYFGPHAFRHALSTTLAEYDPSNPGLAAGVMGISREVNSQHYDRAERAKALQSYSELIDRKIAHTEKHIRSQLSHNAAIVRRERPTNTAVRSANDKMDI